MRQNPTTVRCRLGGSMGPRVCAFIAAILIFIKVISVLVVSGHFNALDIGINITLAIGLFGVTFTTRPSLWTLDQGPFGVRMEQDGQILYEGPISAIRIVAEDRVVMTLCSNSLAVFQFPRRREFNHILSQIGARTSQLSEQVADGKPVTLPS